MLKNLSGRLNSQIVTMTTWTSHSWIPLRTFHLFTAQTLVSLTMTLCLVQKNHTWSWTSMGGMIHVFPNKKNLVFYFNTICIVALGFVINTGKKKSYTLSVTYGVNITWLVHVYHIYLIQSCTYMYVNVQLKREDQMGKGLTWGHGVCRSMHLISN